MFHPSRQQVDDLAQRDRRRVVEIAAVGELAEQRVRGEDVRDRRDEREPRGQPDRCAECYGPADELDHVDRIL
jgi:hypothetical protein